MTSDNDITTEADPESISPKRLLSGLGLAFGIAAFLMASVFPWAAEAFADEPPEPVAEEEVDLVDEVAQAIKRKLRDKLRGEPEDEGEPLLGVVIEQQPRNDKHVNWGIAAPIAVGGIGVCLGVGGFVRHEDQRLSIAAGGLSLAAMLLQYFLIITATILAILVIGAIFSALGGGA